MPGGRARSPTNTRDGGGLNPYASTGHARY